MATLSGDCDVGQLALFPAWPTGNISLKKPWTIVNKAIDQWSNQAFVSAKDNILNTRYLGYLALCGQLNVLTTLNVSEGRKKIHCRTCVVDQRA